MVRVNGEEAKKIIQISTKENIEMIRNEGMENLHGPLEMYIKVNIEMMNERDLVK